MEDTKRQQGEDALQKSRNMLAFILDSVPQSIFWKDRNSVYLGCNDVFARDAGLDSADEIVGKTDFDLPWKREQAEAYRADDREVIDNRRPKFHIIETMRRSDGTQIWVDTTKVPLIDETGEVYGVLGVYENVTERKQAEAERKEHIRFLEGMNSINQAIRVEADIEQMLQKVVMTLLSMFDCDRAWLLYPCDPDAPSFQVPVEASKPEYPGANVLDLDVPMDSEMARNLREALESEDPLTYALGTERPVNTLTAQQFAVQSQMFQAIYPKIGKPWVFGMHQCSHPRIWTNEEKILFREIGRRVADGLSSMLFLRDLQASEFKYRFLIENAGEAIFIAQDGVIKFSNPVTWRITGYAPEELASLPFLNLVHRDDRQIVGERHHERLRGEEPPQTNSFRITNKAGDELWVELNSALISWEGRPATLNFARDITHQRKLESQLLVSRKMEAIGMLAGGVAHDFNNLLTVILGYIEVLNARVPEGDPSHREIDEIRKAGERAADLTRQLLAFSRKQILQLRVININTVLGEMDKMLRRLIGEDIDIRTMLGDGLWSVKADPGQIEQVVMNLAVNAKDAMPGGGRFTIKTSNVFLDEDHSDRNFPVVPGRYVLLSISDTGAGMDEETAAKIFEPFFTTKERGKGTGLGLSTVYGIVKQSGGFIWVSSSPGKGTTFDIYLPRTEQREDVSGKAATLVEDLRGGKTVLVVEDDEPIRNLAVETIARYGYTLLSARDGEDAVRVAGDYRGEIHLLLTDVVMPRMGGRDLFERLQRDRPGIRVLFMSGYTDDAIVHHDVLNPGTAFLQKPFSLISLMSKVKEALDDR